MGIAVSSICMITFYKEQHRRPADSARDTGVDLSTVGVIQGREKNVVVLFTTKEDFQADDAEFLDDPHRMNVARTRCKHGQFVLDHQVGLSGLFVNEYPHRRTLSVVYCRIPKALEQIPPTVAYRKYTAALRRRLHFDRLLAPIYVFRLRSSVSRCFSRRTASALEERTGMKEIEEVIEQVSRCASLEVFSVFSVITFARIK
ncbi:unnamed protein product [Heligmosomoides polygyrus]|uniref:AAA_12 domain-containing protein n=1 Tax=Heligmosomoides polygyrus TaxID=6339 RepID=A0A183F440_HELPZ|nr:unnamed protein product [Heligmosomoides polygyrus]